MRGQEPDKVTALDAGADDYLTKPFGTSELLARMRSAARRAMQVTTSRFQNGQSERGFGAARREHGDSRIQLTPTEYDLLRVLVMQADKVITHRQLLHDVWGDEYKKETHLLRVNISNLRRKIEPDPMRPQYILTEPGVGYRLQTEK